MARERVRFKLTTSCRVICALAGALLGLFGAGALAAPEIGVAPMVSGFSNPLYLTHAGDARLFVVEQPGRIRIVDNGALLPAPFLDLSARLLAGGEQGLLGLAFHPRYKENGRYFVNYTRAPDGATVVAEYRVSSDPNRSGSEERVLIVVPQPFANHNGGMLAFGRDGYLYIGLGDGGAAADPGNRAQNPRELLGKILRIDVEGRPYGIPRDNPFAVSGGRPEIFALGLRNPWRFSFDRATGALWAADVGQGRWEEINRIERGGNYGWRVMEGAHCFLPPFACNTSRFSLPVVEYRNEKPRCSVTGGYVYRGSRIPALVGTYVYGDYCSGEIFGWAEGQQRVLLSTTAKISSFGEDQAGELYLVDHGVGAIHRIVGAPRR